ncbi:histidine kinase [Lachnospiraceae bacterium OttesenSCG-928-D06]|nr:histidine kinase [Lachnospiraceae bacterium OttesenSCG-928-D06]
MNGHDYILINVTLNLTCLVSMASFLITLFFTKSNKTLLHRILLLMLLCQCGLLGSDLIAWLFAARMEAFARPLLLTANFMAYGLGYLMHMLISFYIVHYIEAQYQGMIHKKRIMAGITLLTVSMLIVLIISQFTNWIYYIDENNIYHLGELAPLAQIYNVICIIIEILILFYHGKHLTLRDMWIMLLVLVIPLLGTVSEMLVDENIMFAQIASTISHFMLYISIQVQQEMRAVEMETSLRTSIMLSQIQPHFLYNSLSSIAGLCDVAPHKVKEAIKDFAHYMRGNLEQLKEQRLIPFIDELDHVETYLALEKLRYGERLQVEYEIDVWDFKLPSLTIQPIAENAVKHGVMKKEGGGNVHISIKRKGDIILITILDNGVGFDPLQINTDGKSHIGINNVRSRLLSQCGGTLEIESKQNIGTKAIITLPYIGEGRTF